MARTKVLEESNSALNGVCFSSFRSFLTPEFLMEKPAAKWKLKTILLLKKKKKKKTVLKICSLRGSMINKSNQYLCIIDKRCCQLVDSSKSSSTPFARRIPQFVSIRAFECDTYTVRFMDTVWWYTTSRPQAALEQTAKLNSNRTEFTGTNHCGYSVVDIHTMCASNTFQLEKHPK